MAKYLAILSSFLLLVCFIASEPAWSAKTLTVTPAQYLQGLIHHRLLLMPAVARYKFDRKLPVEDLTREKQILTRGVEQATEMGLDETLANNMLTAQMTAAKMLQQELIDQWQAEPELAKSVATADLATEIRPQISMINEKLMEFFGQDYPQNMCELSREVAALPKSPQYSAAVWQAAVSFLKTETGQCN